MTNQPEPLFPSWRYGPEGAAAIFQTAAEVPPGWTDHPAKLGEGSTTTNQPPPKTAQCPPPKSRSTPAARLKNRRLQKALNPVDAQP